MLTVCTEYILSSFLLLVYIFIFKACILLTAYNWVLDFKSGFDNLCLLIGTLVYLHLIFKNLFIFGSSGSMLLLVGFSSCGEWGRLFIAVRGLLIVVASLVVEYGL